MRQPSAKTVAVVLGLNFAVAWLLASVILSYIAGTELSSSTFFGAVVAGTVFGVLTYAYRRSR